MFIYCATSLSGKSYIGQTRTTVEKRWKAHISDATCQSKNHCKALNNAIRQYGGNSFTVRTVAYCLPWLLDELETSMIKEFGTQVPNGYNIRLGGGSCSQHHEETKAAIRAKLVGKRFSQKTLELRGRSKKREKTFPMYICGWYRKDKLVGARVIHRAVKERRFSLTKYGGLEGCTLAAVAYLQDGMQFND